MHAIQFSKSKYPIYYTTRKARFCQESFLVFYKYFDYPFREVIAITLRFSLRKQSQVEADVGLFHQP